MPWLNVTRAGQVGIALDAPYLEVPPNVWTDGRNIRVQDGRIETILGHDVGAENPSLDNILSLAPVSNPLNHYWAHFGQAKVGGALEAYAFDGTVFHDISPAVAFTGGRADIITPTFLNGNLVMSNTVDQPHGWDVSISNPMTIIPGWDANWRCGFIVAHKGYLVALDITDGSVRRPYRVKWSAEAPPGQLPQSWDALDPTVDAGEFDLGDTTAELQTGVPLRNELMLYTQKDIQGMQLVGGQFVWRFRTVSTQAGALSRRSVAAVGTQHVVMTDQDIVVNNGQNVESIIDNRNRRAYLGTLDESNYGFAFVQPNRLRKEVWCCYPTAGSDYCDRAMVWNYEDNTWGMRDLPAGCLAAANGLDIAGLQTELWSNTVGPWSAAVGPWDLRSFNVIGGLLLLGGDNRTDPPSGFTDAPIFRADQSNQFAGVNKRCGITRLGLLSNEEERRVTIQEVWPRGRGQPFTVRIGFQDEPNGAVSWRVTRTFDPEQDRKIACRMTGRYLCISFESDQDVNWQLDGYRVKWQPGAMR